MRQAKLKAVPEPCPSCGILPQCTTCGDIEGPHVLQCHGCDGERYYYQLQRWREAAIQAVEALGPRWWERLLRRPRALPDSVEKAVKSARELEGEK